MAWARIGNTGERNPVHVSVVRPRNNAEGILHLSRSKGGSQGFPILIQLSHDDAMQLRADSATQSKRPTGSAF